jgi:Arc/MetJ-type ribon-helix-helix transcriptional regulator
VYRPTTGFAVALTFRFAQNSNMTLQLSPDLSARIQAQIATGHFTSEADLIEQALDALERRQHGLVAIREMVRVADADMAAGRVGPFNVEQTMAAIEARLAGR